MTETLILAAFALLMGSVPFGLLVARLFNVRDLTSRGSGNIGATNVTRVLGFWPAGALTFALDVIKGAIPVLLSIPVGARLISTVASMVAPHLRFEALSESVAWAVGCAAVIGHCFSPWLRFRGGKGVATGFGAILILSPWAALAGILAFGLAFVSKRVGSIASLSGLVVASVSHLVLFQGGPHLMWGALMILVIVFRHETNINALLENRENAF